MCLGRGIGVPEFSIHWGRLVFSRLRLVVLWFFHRLITIENAHDRPSFFDELSVSVRKISSLV